MDDDTHAPPGRQPHNGISQALAEGRAKIDAEGNVVPTKRFGFVTTAQSRKRARRIEWLIPDLIPELPGLAALFGGDTGTGKSTLVHTLADQYTRAGPWSVLWIGTEETEVFDLRTLALPPNDAIERVEPALPGLNAAAHLGEVIEAFKFDVHAIVIDPIRDIQVAHDSIEIGNSNASVRQSLSHLRRYGVPIIGITHFSKAQGALIQRVMGATDWTAVPRVVHGLIRLRTGDIRLGRLVNNVGDKRGVWPVYLDRHEVTDSQGKDTEVVLARLGQCDRAADLQEVHDADKRRGAEAVGKEAELREFVEAQGGDVSHVELNAWMEEHGGFGSPTTRSKYRQRVLNKQISGQGRDKRVRYSLNTQGGDSP